MTDATPPGGGLPRAARRRRRRRRDARLNFMLAGVQKAGTSTLFALIGAHPQIATARQKELHFFTDERVDWDSPDYSAYHAKIRWRPGTVIAGEGTPRYVFWPNAMERIRAYNPGMRFIISFRDPIERTFSHWAMLKNDRPSLSDFSTTIKRVWAIRLPRTAKEAGHGTRSMISRGFYDAQLERAMSLFPREQLLLLDYHRVFPALDQTLGRIVEFLGVDPFGEPASPKHKRAAPQELVAAPPTAADVTALAELFQPDLEGFASRSGLDVSDWPTARVIDGSLPAGELAAALAARANLVLPDGANPGAGSGAPAAATS